MFMYVSGISSEVIRGDARDMGLVFRDHPLAMRLAGIPNIVDNPVVVVELDPPFSKAIVDKFGDQFAPWHEEDLERTLKSLCNDLPFYAFTVIVRIEM